MVISLKFSAKDRRSEDGPGQREQGCDGFAKASLPFKG